MRIQQLVLGGQDVKNLGISLRTPDLENGKEEIQVQTSIDSGLLATTGKIKCKLVFENEAWSIATIEKNSNEELYIRIITKSFLMKKLIEAIRKQGLEETSILFKFFWWQRIYHK